MGRIDKWDKRNQEIFEIEAQAHKRERLRYHSLVTPSGKQLLVVARRRCYSISGLESDYLWTRVPMGITFCHIANFRRPKWVVEIFESRKPIFRTDSKDESSAVEVGNRIAETLKRDGTASFEPIRVRLYHRLLRMTPRATAHIGATE